MKVYLFLAAMFVGFAASAQECKVTTTTDAVTKISTTRTQDEVVISVAGRRWVYSMSKSNGVNALHLRYTQSDMVFTVPNSATLTLTAQDGTSITLPVQKGAEGELKHNKGVKTWTVNLTFPLNNMQFSQLQSPIKNMTLQLGKGQANMAVPEKKINVFAELVKCISQ